MPASKRSIVYRIRGLSPHCTEAELRDILESCLSEDEIAVFHPKISIVPSCYHDDSTCTALLTADVSLQFLSELNENPLIDWPIETNDGDLNFDRHFHGFTQLYPTAKGKPITAE